MEHSYELSGYRKAEALWRQDASGLAATPSLFVLTRAVLAKLARWTNHHTRSANYSLASQARIIQSAGLRRIIRFQGAKLPCPMAVSSLYGC